MRALLDTHIVLWALTDDRRLGPFAREIIAEPDNVLFVSAASIWEIAIKHALGRSSLPFAAADAIDYCAQAGYQFLNVTPQHAAAVERLPHVHADPFDRILVAQAMVDPLRLITHDETLAGYGSAVLLV